jgi:hypothetical protein
MFNHVLVVKVTGCRFHKVIFNLIIWSYGTYPARAGMVHTVIFYLIIEPYVTYPARAGTFLEPLRGQKYKNCPEYRNL